MSIDNNSFVKKSKEIFNQLGVSVKTQQLYEFYSKLTGEKNWNISKAKGINFAQKLSIDNSSEVKTFEDILSVTPPYIYPSHKIKTTIEDLDNNLSGGLPSRGLVLVGGGVNVGKSLFTVSLGCQAIRQGYKVLHLNLQGGSAQETLFRYLANLAETNYSQILKNPNSVAPEAQAKIESFYKDKLAVRSFANFKSSIEFLSSYVKELYKTYKCDMLIVDMPQLLESEKLIPAENYKFKHQQINSYVAKELLALAQGLNCVVVAPVQNTGGAGICESLPEYAEVAEVVLNLKSKDEKSIKILLEKNRGVRNKEYSILTNYSQSNLLKGSSI